MAWFPRLTRRRSWANGGAIAPPSDAQWDQGFSFLGNTPPSVELFNALLYERDEQIRWLYDQLSYVMRSGGITPAETPDTQLASALRNTFGGAGAINAAGNGWVYLQGGLILQFGWIASVPPGGSVNILYPITFPVGSLAGSATAGENAIDLSMNIGGPGSTRANFTIKNFSAVAGDVSWMILGR